MRGSSLTHILCDKCQMPLMTHDGKNTCVVCPHVHKRAKKIAHRKRKKNGLLAAAKGIDLITNKKLEKVRREKCSDSRSLHGKASVEEIMSEDENDHENSNIQKYDLCETEKMQCSPSIEEKSPNNMISFEQSDDQPQRKYPENFAKESQEGDLISSPKDHQKIIINRTCEGNNTLFDSTHNRVVGVGPDSDRRSSISRNNEAQLNDGVLFKTSSMEQVVNTTSVHSSSYTIHGKGDDVYSQYLSQHISQEAGSCSIDGDIIEIDVFSTNNCCDSLSSLPNTTDRRRQLSAPSNDSGPATKDQSLTDIMSGYTQGSENFLQNSRSYARDEQCIGNQNNNIPFSRRRNDDGEKINRILPMNSIIDRSKIAPNESNVSEMTHHDESVAQRHGFSKYHDNRNVGKNAIKRAKKRSPPILYKKSESYDICEPVENDIPNELFALSGWKM